MITKTGLCLSIRQPWAWLIVRPDVVEAAHRRELVALDIIKPVENRDWPTRVRGWIGIHAAKKIDLDGMQFVFNEFPQIIMPAHFDRGGIVGRAVLSDCVRDHPSRWFFGDYGFVLDNAEPLPFKPCRDLLGFFRPTFDNAEAVS